MSQRAPIQILYNPIRTYPGTTQNNFPGASSVVGRRGVLPTFTDVNSKFVAKAGSDTTGTGTFAAPFLTIGKAFTQIAGAFVFTVIKDSGVYNEQSSVNFTGVLAPGGLYSLDGQNPTIKLTRGCVVGTYGARQTGRTKFSAGAPATFLYVALTGNNATAARGNPALPFTNIDAALAYAGANGGGARAANDTVQVQDSGIYFTAINAAALNVTIQSAAGQIPTLKPVGATHVTANAGVTVNLYGLNFVDTQAVSVVVLTGSSDIYDCTFTGGLFQLTLAGNVKTYNIVNCQFSSVQNESIISNAVTTTTYNITNCFFLECTTSGPESVILALGSTSISIWNIDFCTFENTNAGVSCFGIRGNGPSANAPSITMNLTNSIFTDKRSTPSTAAAFSSTVGANGSITMNNCLFDHLGGPVFNDTTTVGVASLSMKGCAALYCSSMTPTLADVILAFAYTANVTDIYSCAFIGSKFAGVQARGSFGGGGQIRNCAFLNCGSYGYRGLAGLVPLISCLEANSGINSAVNATVNYCVFKTAGTGLVIGTGFYAVTDPMFLGTAPGVENTGISAASPAVNRDQFRDNIGPLNPTLTILGSGIGVGFTVDGITFDGDKYFQDGIQTGGGQNPSITISHCTFTGLAGQAIIAAAGVTITQCLGTSLNGHMINMTEAGGSVIRNVGQNGAGAFLILGAVIQTVNHNTAYGNEYGQFDQGAQAALTLKNNVYCGNGVLDYSGSGTQTTSDICRSSPGAVVTGSTANPLFRDTAIPDLRIQTVETGFFTNSPAKGLADDGTDAGAYDFTYGALSLTWTLVNFATGAGNSNLAYRNPEHVVRVVQPLKLSEGDTFGGVTFSTAPAFKTEHRLTWDPDVNMPTAQVADLILIYTTGDGETQISFDAGATFIPVRLLRSTAFERTEIEGAFYSDDSLPTPVHELLFRESN